VMRPMTLDTKSTCNKAIKFASLLVYDADCRSISISEMGVIGTAWVRNY